MNSFSLEELDSAAICFGCVGEDYLKSLIETHGEERTCKYCRKISTSFTIEEIAEHVDRAFESHYSRTATEPEGLERVFHNDSEIDYEWERKGEQTVDVIMDAVDISIEAAQDIQKIIFAKYYDFDVSEETEFDEEAHYERKSPSDREWKKSWQNFEKSLKHEARFFNRIGETKLRELFDDIDTLQTREGQPLVVSAGPNTEYSQIFRARVFQSDDGIRKALERPDLEFSAPPSMLATAGRMNAKGISVFYGATIPEIAIAEVRPPIGSEVVVASFEIIRPLKLLNLNLLTDLHESGSIFDPLYATRLSRIKFLSSFRDRISRPIMPHEQDFEYLCTQAFADYLANECKVSIDGVIFPSAQSGENGLNIVLFYKSSLCEELYLLQEAEIKVSTYEQYDYDESLRQYIIDIKEKTPSAQLEAPPKNYYSLSRKTLPSDVQLNNLRKFTLKIILNSIRVHIVETVTFKTQPFFVQVVKS